MGHQAVEHWSVLQALHLQQAKRRCQARHMAGSVIQHMLK